MNTNPLPMRVMMSMYTTFFCNDPMDVATDELLTLTQSPELQHRTAEIRRLRARAEDMTLSADQRLLCRQRADAQKMRTPAVLPNVYCLGGKKRQHIQHFLPQIGFDIDHVSEAEAERLMQLMRQDAHILFAQPSSSRHGIHGFLHIDCAEWLNQQWDGRSTQPFDHAWQQARQYVEQLLGLPVDDKCRNPEHIFGLCYDPLTHLNPLALPLHIDTDSYRPAPQRQARTSAPVANSATGPHQATIDAAAPHIDGLLAQHGCLFVPENRNKYLFRFAALANEYGVPHADTEDYAMVHLMDTDFDAAEIARTVASAYAHTAQHGTRPLPAARHAAVLTASAPDPAPAPGPASSPAEAPRGRGRRTKRQLVDVAQVEQALLQYGQWRYNEVTLEYEVCPAGHDRYRPLRDEDENEVYRQALSRGIFLNVNHVHAIIRSAFTPHYHPFRQYFQELPACTLLPDGTCLLESRPDAQPTDYIAQLAARIHVQSDPAQFLHYFRMWLVAMVGSLAGLSEVNHYVLGLFGRQGIYKTTFFKLLLPPAFQQHYFYLKSNSRSMDKDDRLKMATNALICLEEMDTISPSELNQLKAHITMTTIDERPPYGRCVEHRPRICSFCMTGNQPQFLSDTTGNRRFLPFMVDSIDDPHLAFDYDAVYAQAYALAQPQSGFTCYLPQSELEALNQHNEHFMAPVIEHELVDKYLAIPCEGCTDGVMESAANIKVYLETFTRERLDARKICAYMRKVGFSSYRQSCGIKYYILKLSNDAIRSNQRLEAAGM